VILETRSSVYSLPSYSLTGDLLGFLRCGLQYRYTVIGQLPSSHPVQMWFGQFIHGVLEEAYRVFDGARQQGKRDVPPWPELRIVELCERIEKRLGAQGLFPWSEELRTLGRNRAKAALDELAPDLFPLIHRAEVRLTGARSLAEAKKRGVERNSDRYEMVGVVDVLTHLELKDPALAENRLVQLILAQLPKDLPEKFELILDYKGMRRPPVVKGKGPQYWDIYGWQVQTYAHLRSIQDDEDRYPVVGGALLYLNELFPTWTDVELQLKESRRNTTDVTLSSDPEAARILGAPRRGEEFPPLAPAAFRLRRALRVIPVTEASVQESLGKFDDVVARIETCRQREAAEGKVINCWERNATDEGTCAACDSRTWCPGFTKELKPRVPGVRRRRG